MKYNKLFNRIFVSFLTVFLLILNINLPVKAEEPLNNENTVETLQQEEDYYPNKFTGPEYDPGYYEMMNCDSEINTVNTIATYTVKYDGNDATSGSTANTTHTNGDESTLAMNGFKKKGYLFEGWNTRKDGFGESYKEGQKVSNLSSVDGDVVTLYATWSIESDTFEISIPSDIVLKNDGNGNLSGDISLGVTTKQRRWVDVSVNSKNNFNLIESNGTKIPYELSDKNFKLEPQYKADDVYSSNKNISVKASENGYAGDYIDNVSFNIDTYYNTRTIQLDCNGGSVNGQSNIVYTVRDDASYGKLPLPTRSGYQFVAWQDDNGETIYSGSMVKPTTEKLTAKWEQIFSIVVASQINGKENSYFSNCGKATLYINGKKYTDYPDFLYATGLVKGDTFKVDDIEAQEGYVYTGYSTGCGSNFSFEYYPDGKVKSVSGTFDKTSVWLYFNFESDTPLQRLIREYNSSVIVIDSNKPQNVTPLGNLNLFESSANYYIDNNEIHIYNPDGGKVIAKSDSGYLFSSLTATKIDARGLDTSNCTNLSRAFYQDSKLTELLIDNWDVSNCVYAEGMFSYCSLITRLQLEKWNVEKLKSSKVNVLCYGKTRKFGFYQELEYNFS